MDLVLAGFDHIAVKNPRRLPVRLGAERVGLGLPGDYKPTIVQLKSGDLLVVAFASRGRESSPAKPTRLKLDEYLVSFRSKCRTDVVIPRRTDGRAGK